MRNAKGGLDILVSRAAELLRYVDQCRVPKHAKDKSQDHDYKNQSEEFNFHGVDRDSGT